MIKLLIALLLLTLPAQAYNLSGKQWVEPIATIALPASLSDKKIKNRIRYIAIQFRRNVPFKVRTEVLDGAFASTLDAIYYATDTDSIVILYAPGEDFGLGNRVANASFITSQGGTLVHGGVIRINDIRLKQVAGDTSNGRGLNYLSNVIGHEVGHLYGLDHSTPGTKPVPIMTSSGKFSNRKRLGLAKDDKKGLRKIYRSIN